MKNILTAFLFCLAAAPAAGGAPGPQPYTEPGYFSVTFPQGWVKKEEGMGLSADRKSVV